MRTNDAPVLVTAKLRSGAYLLRGAPIARTFDLVVRKPREFASRTATLDMILLIKRSDGYESHIRRSCRRLIYDPIDCWRPLIPGVFKGNVNECISFWRHQYKLLQFDDVLATSPAMHHVLAESLPATVKIWHVPHHADPNLYSKYNKNGPVVYVGHRGYLGESVLAISRACQSLGHQFEITDDPRKLHGASLAVALRLPPTDTDLNRWCKPQVKLENAAAVSLPVLASDHPAVVSLRPECYVVPNAVADWAFHIRAALSSQRLSNPVREPEFLEQMKRVLFNGSAIAR